MVIQGCNSNVSIGRFTEEYLDNAYGYYCQRMATRYRLRQLIRALVPFLASHHGRRAHHHMLLQAGFFPGDSYETLLKT